MGAVNYLDIDKIKVQDGDGRLDISINLFILSIRSNTCHSKVICLGLFYVILW